MRGRIILGMLLVALLPAKSMAQDDDLYFTPKDEPVEEPAIESVPMAHRVLGRQGSISRFIADSRDLRGRR